MQPLSPPPSETGTRSRRSVMLRTPLGLSATVSVCLLVALAALGPVIWGDAASTKVVADRLLPPSATHLLGTDELGRDVLARVLTATRLSLLLALAATVIWVSGGLVLGTLPTVLGRRARRLLTSTIEILMAFPWLLLALFFSVIWGASGTGAVLAVGCAGIPAFARLVYTLASAVSGRDYVAAARVVGVGRLRRVVRHVLPNIAEPLIVNATVGAGTSLLAFASLSFLGLGVQAPAYDWGRLLGEGMSRIYVNPLLALAPGVAVVLAGLALNLLGEALASAAGFRVTLSRPRVRERAKRAATTPADGELLAVENLRVTFGDTTPVRDVSFTVAPGEKVGIVGASGSGKTLTALACAGLVDEGDVDADRLTLFGHDMLHPPDRQATAELGTSLALVFQDPMTSLNPSLQVGRQLAEVVEVHQDKDRRASWSRAVDRLDAVRIPDPGTRAHQYPHQFSGGMRQRAMIGMGLMGRPRLIIADEPTTALDVTVQRQVLALLEQARRDTGSAILFISHDIALVSGFCDRVLVMRDGVVVEELPADELDRGRHPYTRALLACVPEMATDRDAPLRTIEDFDVEEVST